MPSVSCSKWGTKCEIYKWHSRKGNIYKHTLPFPVKKKKKRFILYLCAVSCYAWVHPSSASLLNIEMGNVYRLRNWRNSLNMTDMPADKGQCRMAPTRMTRPPGKSVRDCAITAFKQRFKQCRMWRVWGATWIFAVQQILSLVICLLIATLRRKISLSSSICDWVWTTYISCSQSQALHHMQKYTSAVRNNHCFNE